jgi:ribosome-interacting GTPase 1
MSKQLEASAKLVSDVTERHIGMLRAKISTLKERELTGVLQGKSGGGGGYSVKKHGDASVVLVGPPSVGKSTLINALTNASSRVAAYEFTTLSVIPGMMEYRGARFQILDVPGIIEGAGQGKGRGKEVISVVRNADLIIFMTDVYKLPMLDILRQEVETTGVRVNTPPPAVRIEKRIDGGLVIASNVKQELDRETLKEIARERGIKNGIITLKESVSIDRFIDALTPNRVYLPALFLINKVDALKEAPAHKKGYLYISAAKEQGLTELKEAIWNILGFVTVYLVRPENDPSQDEPMIVKNTFTLSDLAQSIGTEFAEGKIAAKIWGNGAKFAGQEVSLTAKVQDGMMVRFL